MDLIIPEKIYMNYNYDGFLRRASKILLGDKVRLDLQKIKFIRPEAVILLIVLSDELYHQGIIDPTELGFDVTFAELIACD